MKNLLIGLILLLGSSIFAGRETWLAMQSKRWPATTGVITESKSRQNGRYRLVLDPVYISYDYVVNNQSYCGSQIQYGVLRKRDLFLYKYPINKHVPVYYNPNNFGQAVLEPGFYWLNFWMYFFFILIAIFISVPFLKDRWVPTVHVRKLP